MTELALDFPPELVEAIAQRAAEIVLERQPPIGSCERPSPNATIAEAAEYLRCKRQRIYDLLSQRRLTRIKDGGRTLVAWDELDAYLRGEPTGPAGAKLSASAVSQRLPRAYRDGYASAIRS